MGGGGGSKEQTVGYKYYLGMHMINCHGEIDGVIKIKVDDREAWSGFIANGSIAINQPELFGGDSREGGIVGIVDVVPGSQVQGQNDYLVAQLGSDVPAFRGVAALILRQVYLGLNPYLKRWSSLVQRIHKKSNGSTQWYDAKSAILFKQGSVFDATVKLLTRFQGASSADVSTYNLGSGSVSWPSGVLLTDGILRMGVTTGPGPSDLSGIGWSSTELSSTQAQNPDMTWEFIYSVTADAGYLAFCTIAIIDIGYYVGIGQRQIRISVNGGSIGTYSAGCLYVASMADYAVGWTSPASVLTNDGVSSFHVAIQKRSNGNVAVYFNGSLVANFGVITGFTGDAGGTGGAGLVEVCSYGYNPDWEVRCFGLRAASRHIYSGSTYTVPTPSNLTADFDIVIPSLYDMNPAHIIRECLTDSNWGMGYQESDIDDVTFASAADQLFDEGMGLSLIWDRQTRIEDFIQEVIKHIYATLYVDRITGQFVLKLIRNDYVFGSLPQLDESNISKIDSYSRPSFGDLVNSVTVNYLETTSNKTQSVTVQDTALVQLQGSVIGTTIQYPGFSNYGIAARAAQRDLVSLSTPLLTCSLTADRSVSNLNVGSVFKLYWPDFSDQVIAMRITGMSFGDGRSNKIKITCMEDIFSIPTTVITSPGDSEWVDPSTPPTPATNVSVLEAPYIEIVQRVGQSVIDASLVTNPDLGYLQVAVGRPGNAINCDVYEDSSGSFTHSFYQDFAPSGLLAIAISPVDTVITLKNYADLDLLIVGSSAQIDNEIVKIVAIVDANVTIGRGLFDTTPKSHAIDAKFISWDLFSGTDDIEYVNSESFNVKVLPISGSGKVSIADASANNIVFNRRAIRPYLPGQIKIAGSYFPASLVDTTISMTWAHRNRIQQTGADYLTFLSASITPEVGTTYSIRLYNNTTSALIYSVDGLTGTSHSGFPSMTGAFTLRIELWTVRDTYTSFQTFSHIFSYANIPRLTTEVGSTERLLTEAGDTLTTE